MDSRELSLFLELEFGHLEHPVSLLGQFELESATAFILIFLAEPPPRLVVAKLV